MAQSSAPSGKSRLGDENSDKVGSCSRIMVRLRCIKASQSASNNVYGASVEVAGGSTTVKKIAGGQSMSLPVTYALMPELNSSRHSRIRSYYSFSATIASRMPYMLYGALFGTSVAQELAQILSTRLIGVA